MIKSSRLIRAFIGLEKKSLLLWGLFGFFSFSGSSQHFYFPEGWAYRYDLEYQAATRDTFTHTAVWPFQTKEFGNQNVLDWTTENPKEDWERTAFKKSSWLGRKLWNESLIRLEKPDYAIRIDPVVDFSFGNQSTSIETPYSQTWNNTRGFYMEGRIGQQVSFTTSYLENQSVFPTYMVQRVDSTHVAPGFGKTRPFGDYGYDYGIASGVVAFRPSKFFTFSLGHGKNSFGEGYRSLFLSDGAFNYPYFKIETSFWRIKYVNLYTHMTDIRPQVSQNGIYKRKYTTMHFLSWQVTDDLNLNFFEGIVWSDSTLQGGFQFDFINPVIFYRPIEFAVGSAGGNALMGMGGSYRLFKKYKVYGQFSLDEFNAEALQASSGSWLNKFGWQIGVKGVGKVGPARWFALLEWNAVRPYTYSHREVVTNYGHYNEPLGHIWGANFSEVVFKTHWDWDRITADLQVNFGYQGLDTAGSNWGGNIYLPYNTREQDNGNDIGQGLRANRMITEAKVGYLINPATRLTTEFGYRYRRESYSWDAIPDFTTHYVFFGVKTDLFNRYSDF